MTTKSTDTDDGGDDDDNPAHSSDTAGLGDAIRTDEIDDRTFGREAQEKIASFHTEITNTVRANEEGGAKTTINSRAH